MADEDQENQDDQSGGEGEGGGSKKKLLIIGIGLFVVVLAAAAGGFFFLSKGGGEAAPSESQDAAAAEAKEGEAKEGEAKEGEAKEGEAKEGEAKEGAAKEGAAKEKASDEEEDVETFGMGKTISLKPFHLNLGNPLENHYVRLEISIEVGQNRDAETELERRKAQLRDAIVSIVSHKTREFLLNPDGKEQLRSEILRRINRYMKNKVNQVFITDMLIE